MLTVALVAGVGGSVGGCAHLKEDRMASPAWTAEELLRTMRWRHHLAAADLIIPERRQAFLDARESEHDERDLSISDYELRELRGSEDGQRVYVTALVRWVRLPSVTEQAEVTTLELVRRGDAWLVGRVLKGPFSTGMDAPIPEPEPEQEPSP